MDHDVMTNGELQTAIDLIAAVQKKAGIKGAFAELQRIELLDRVVRTEDGSFALRLEHPTTAESPRPLGVTLGHTPWLAFASRLHAIADGLRLYFSADSPALALARRRRTLIDEERTAELERRRIRAAAQARQEAQTREHARLRDWRALSAAERAIVRLGADFTASEFARGLVAESATATLPPDGWEVTVTAPAVVAPVEEHAEEIAANNQEIKGVAHE